MRNTFLLAFCCLAMTLPSGFSQLDSVFYCDVRFEDSKFDNQHAGSGFLLEYKEEVFAITAKHVLFFAKTDNMKTISLDKSLVSWKFCSKAGDQKCVTVGKLINENKMEALEMPPKGDWLIFETGKNLPENIAKYTVRTSPLVEGENLVFMGYPYDSKQPIRIEGKYLGPTADNNLRMDVAKGTYNGCSGGPVLDTQGNLVGLVSMGYFNATEQKMVFEPASLDYFFQVMKQYNK